MKESGLQLTLKSLSISLAEHWQRHKSIMTRSSCGDLTRAVLLRSRQPLLVAYYLWQCATFICGIQGFPDETSNPSSAPHYGNLTSSWWAVKGTLKRTLDKGAYASEGRGRRAPRSDVWMKIHSNTIIGLNWNAADNDSLCYTVYEGERPLIYGCIVPKPHFAGWNIVPWSAWDTRWLMPPCVPGYQIRESYGLVAIFRR